MTDRLVALISLASDGRIELRSPAVGFWRSGPERGAVVTSGTALGSVEMLGVQWPLHAPVSARGAVVELPGGPSRARVPVGYGELLAVLDPEAVGEQAAAAVMGQAQQVGSDGLVLRAPTSGRFYCKPGPGKPPFLAAGQEVATGATVCLLEVMKTFNRVTYGGDGLPARARVEAIVPADGADLSSGDIILQLAEL